HELLLELLEAFARLRLLPLGLFILPRLVLGPGQQPRQGQHHQSRHYTVHRTRPSLVNRPEPAGPHLHKQATGPWVRSSPAIPLAYPTPTPAGRDLPCEQHLPPAEKAGGGV